MQIYSLIRLKKELTLDFSTIKQFTQVKYRFLLILSILVLSLSAQNDLYYNKPSLRYDDYIYQKGIKTVRFHPTGDNLGLPIIKLHSGDVLSLSFDDLAEDYANFSYTVIHCNADWQPSGLMKAEYLSNLQDFYIVDFEYSQNALIPYTNYKLTIPNPNLQFSKSGNYILMVYRDDDKSQLVLTRRFMVYETLVSAGGRINRATQVADMITKQEVDFIINHAGYTIQNPFQDLHVTVMQNQRWDNALTTLKPQFVQNGKLTYQYDGVNTFLGLNEHRFFDTKNLQVLSQNVRRINMDSVYKAYLAIDQPRIISKYAVNFDINGQYVVRRLDAIDSDLEADYVYVNFMLEYPQPLTQGDLFIFGKFSDWKLLPEYRLTYNYSRKAYLGSFVLKQGYYNYLYAVQNENGSADIETIEGSHWETENTYQILIYNREVGSRFDRLIGYSELSSEDLY